MKRKISFFLLSGLIFSGMIQAAPTSRDFPVPQTVSVDMQKSIAAVNNSWKFDIKAAEEWFPLIDSSYRYGSHNTKIMTDYFKVSIDEGYIGNVHTYTLTPPSIPDAHKDKVILFIHGGGYVLNPGIAGIDEGIMMAGIGGYKVVAVDYRMAPKHPYPAAIDDAFTVYKKLLKEYPGKNIGVFGSSTGGGMTLVLAMQARDNNVAMPGALAPCTPWTDLTETGDTYFTNRHVDNSLVGYDGWIDDAARDYAQGNDLKDPYLSPVYGDVTGFPPTLLVSGTRDLFLSNTVRMQQKLNEAGIENNLIVYEGQSHCQFYLGLPPTAKELQDHYKNLTVFFDKHLGK